jgi:acyl carrier protein
MTREEIQKEILEIMEAKFEIEDPGLDDDLREAHNFDSIDAIDLIASIEAMLDASLTDDDKKAALDIRTINDIVSYVFRLSEDRG